MKRSIENVLGVVDSTPKKKKKNIHEFYIEIDLKDDKSFEIDTMFNSCTEDAVKLFVWGAPTFIYIHRQVVNDLECSMFEMLLYTEHDKKLSLEENILKTICKDSSKLFHFWKSIWIYFGILYGTIISEVTSSNRIHVSEEKKISMDVCIDIIKFCDFLGDSKTLDVIGRSMIYSLNNYNCTHPSVHSFNDLYYLACDMDSDEASSIFEFLSDIICKTKSTPIPGAVCFIQTILRQTKKRYWKSKSMLKNIFRYLIQYEKLHYQEGKLGKYTENENDDIQQCFISLQYHNWKHLKSFGESWKCVDTKITIFRFYSYNRSYVNTLCDIELGMKRLRHYWLFVFPNLPTHVSEKLILSGSTVPMCLLDFFIPNFRVAVSTLFSESDMDVYIVGDQPEKTADTVAAYLHTTHGNVWQERVSVSLQETSGLEITTTTLVLPIHPLFKKRSLRLQLIRYRSTDSSTLRITPQQIVLHHHLCPVRAYYSPIEDRVIAAPTALLAWSTGYMKYYRHNNGEEGKLSPLCNYLQRRFGVLIQNKDNDSCRLKAVTEKALKLFPKSMSERLQSKKITMPDCSNLLLSFSSSTWDLNSFDNNELSGDELRLFDEEVLY